MTRYWGQIAVALSVALGAGYWLFSTGRAPLTAGLAGLVAYFLVRWLIAWLYRIEYWHNRDGNRSRNCPECGQYIYRKRGDWVLKCTAVARRWGSRASAGSATLSQQCNSNGRWSARRSCSSSLQLHS